VGGDVAGDGASAALVVCVAALAAGGRDVRDTSRGAAAAAGPGPAALRYHLDVGGDGAGRTIERAVRLPHRFRAGAVSGDRGGAARGGSDLLAVERAEDTRRHVLAALQPLEAGEVVRGAVADHGRET
jgi:hypothetical protein